MKRSATRIRTTTDLCTVQGEEVLQQNAFTQYDLFCPLLKTAWMLRNIVAFHESAMAAVRSPGCITVEAVLKQHPGFLSALYEMKFSDDRRDDRAIAERFQKQRDAIVSAFAL